MSDLSRRRDTPGDILGAMAARQQSLAARPRASSLPSPQHLAFFGREKKTTATPPEAPPAGKSREPSIPPLTPVPRRTPVPPPPAAPAQRAAPSARATGLPSGPGPRLAPTPTAAPPVRPLVIASHGPPPSRAMPAHIPDAKVTPARPMPIATHGVPPVTRAPMAPHGADARVTQAPTTPHNPDARVTPAARLPASFRSGAPVPTVHPIRQQSPGVAAAPRAPDAVRTREPIDTGPLRMHQFGGVPTAEQQLGRLGFRSRESIYAGMGVRTPTDIGHPPSLAPSGGPRTLPQPPGAPSGDWQGAPRPAPSPVASVSRPENGEAGGGALSGLLHELLSLLRRLSSDLGRGRSAATRPGPQPDGSFKPRGPSWGVFGGGSG